MVLAADLGATHATLAVTDLGAEVIGELTEPIEIADGPDHVLSRLWTIWSTILTEAGRTADDVAGVGIGVPGPVEFATGRPTNPPIMPGWDGFDIPAFMHRFVDAPVLVDNDVNLMALGEFDEGWRDDRHLLFVKIATGIGAGIVSDGRLNRGAQGSAGDLGHVQAPGAARRRMHLRQHRLPGGGGRGPGHRRPAAGPGGRRRLDRRCRRPDPGGQRVLRCRRSGRPAG